MIHNFSEVQRNIVSQKFDSAESFNAHLSSLSTEVRKDLIDCGFVDDKLAYIALTAIPDTGFSIKSLNPWQSLSIYNHMVQLLHLHKTTPTNMLIRAMDNDEYVDADTMCWVDILAKLTNVANRVQATTYLEKPSIKEASVSSVSRLTYYGNKLLSIIFLRDKVGKLNTLPTRVPLTQPASTFICMLVCAKLLASSRYVFVGDNLNEWKACSSKVRSYVTRTMNVPDHLFPRQHFLRALFINRFLVEREYSERALRLVGIVSRNHGETVESHYASWASLYHEMRHVHKTYICHVLCRVLS